MQTTDFYVRVLGGAAKLTDPLYNDYKVLAQEMWSSDLCYYNKIVALYILHLFEKASDSNNGTPGNVKSEKEGQVSVTYNSSKKTDMYPELSSTRWGLEILELLDKCIITVNMC